MSWTDFPLSLSPFTSSTSSPGLSWPLRSAAPPFTTRPMTTRSPSFRTVAPCIGWSWMNCGAFALCLLSYHKSITAFTSLTKGSFCLMILTTRVTSLALPAAAAAAAASFSTLASDIGGGGCGTVLDVHGSGWLAVGWRRIRGRLRQWWLRRLRRRLRERRRRI